MKTSMMNKLAKKAYSKAIVLLILGSTILSCNDEDRKFKDTELQLDSLSRELSKYKRTSDSLRALIAKGDIAAEYPIFFGEGFDTIENPKEFVQKSLLEKPDKIPLKPVAGGTMAFREVKILTEDWVLGTYDDGHIQGKSIYRYRLQPDGTLKFTLVASREPKE
jgi:hypothetical protein